MRSKLLNNESAFTLLETLIASAIMLIAFSSILMVESGSLDASTRARTMNIVAMLAKQALIDSEIALEGRDFTEVKTEETGSFPDPYQDYQWKREIKEIEFPSIDLAAADENSESNNNPSSAPQNSNANMMNMLGKLISKHLSKSIREVIVTVSWKKGGKPQSYSVSWYWVNLNNDFALSE
jgi:general secretion pathway protein I